MKHSVFITYLLSYFTIMKHHLVVERLCRCILYIRCYKASLSQRTLLLVQVRKGNQAGNGVGAVNVNVILCG